MDDRTRFTTDQVLRGIQVYVREEVDERLAIDPDASVNDYREAIEESHECPLMFLEALADYFGFCYGESRWAVWLKLRGNEKMTKAERKRAWENWQRVTSKSITVRKLAEHIAKRAPGASMQPLTVFGIPCAPAGTFRGLCDLAQLGGTRVGPSTPLWQELRGGRLRQFWGKVQWASDIALPPLRPALSENWLSRGFLASAFAGLAFCTGMAVMVLFDWRPDAWLPAMFGGIVLPVVLLCLLEAVTDEYRNPLPNHIATFGDLAKLVASSRAN